MNRLLKHFFTFFAICLLAVLIVKGGIIHVLLEKISPPVSSLNNPSPDDVATILEDNFMAQIKALYPSYMPDTDTLSPEAVARLEYRLREQIKILYPSYVPNNLSPRVTILDILDDNFTEQIKTFDYPSYILAKDFPQEHIKTLNNFLLFCASVKETMTYNEKRLHPYLLYLQSVEARLKCEIPLKYEDFLSAVSMSFSFCGAYSQLFALPSRNNFFVDNILTPLAHDLKVKTYRGYHFSDKNIPAFFREYAANFLKIYAADPLHFNPFAYAYEGAMWRIDPKFDFMEVTLSKIYALTFMDVYNANLPRAYLSMYVDPANWQEKWRYEERPYYFYPDKERYQWFLFLQEELRHNGHTEYADNIFKIELDHYRELIVWQLRQRAYLIEKLHEHGDFLSLSKLKELLESEYNRLRSCDFFEWNFVNAIESLRDMDSKVNISQSSVSAIVLPWIDRKELDRRQGFDNRIYRHISHDPITWRVDWELISNRSKEKMRQDYEWEICYLRLLVVIYDRLYSRNDLEKMTLLHSFLLDNQDVRRRDGDQTVGEIVLPWVEVQNGWFE